MILGVLQGQGDPHRARMISEMGCLDKDDMHRRDHAID